MSHRAQLEYFARKADEASARGLSVDVLPVVQAGLLLRHMTAECALEHARTMVKHLEHVVEAETRAKTIGGRR